MAGERANAGPAGFGPAGPFGWWSVPDVEAAEDLRGGSLRFAPDSVGIVSANSKIVASRPCKTIVQGDSIAVTGCGPLFSGTLAGGQITVAAGYTLTRAPATSVGQLDTLLAGAVKDCERARACYRAAYPLLGRVQNEAFDFSVGPTGDTCVNLVLGLADDVRQANLQVPPACK